MTALEITKTLKANKNGLLWVNDERRAGINPRGLTVSTPVGPAIHNRD
jgi:hypothetical protein